MSAWPLGADGVVFDVEGAVVPRRGMVLVSAWWWMLWGCVGGCGGARAVDVATLIPVSGGVGLWGRGVARCLVSPGPAARGAGREPEKARRLARRLAADLASEEQLRSLLLEALLREAATRDDLEKLGERIEERLEKLRGEIRRLGERMDTLMKWMIGLLVTIWGTVAAIGIAVLKLLAG